MARYLIKVYDVLLTSDKKILSDDATKIKVKVVSKLKLTNKTAYNGMKLSHEETVCFHIVEETSTKYNKYRDVKQARKKLSINF